MLVGTTNSDDACVYRLNDEQAIVQTVDYFTPIVDDPYLFGQISAANSLSDIYAMGATPIFALSIVGFPSRTLPLEILEKILLGGSDKAKEAGIPIIGGHSIDDPEPKYGLCVTGMIHPDKIISNVGAKPGDQLVLTKPLGSGIIVTGIKQQKVNNAAIEKVVNVMTTLNKDGADVMTRVGITTATDVTGFGILGHLWNILRSSNVAARIYASAVPVLEEVWPLIEQNLVPGGTKRNLEYMEPHVKWDSHITQAQKYVLCDAQTSGGLLIAVSKNKVNILLSKLKEKQTLAAAVVGEILETGLPYIEVVSEHLL